MKRSLRNVAGEADNHERGSNVTAQDSNEQRRRQALSTGTRPHEFLQGVSPLVGGGMTADAAMLPYQLDAPSLDTS